MGTTTKPVAENSIPQLGAWGKHDCITMGRRSSVLKVRDGSTEHEDPEWHENPRGTVLPPNHAVKLRRNGSVKVKKG